MSQILRSLASGIVAVVCLLNAGCATPIASVPLELHQDDTVAFGRVRVFLTGPTTRAFLPEMRFFELVSQETGNRYRIDIGSADAPMYLSLPPGKYELTRIMINEGAFQAMANPGPTFLVRPNRLNYVGTWQFEVSSPTYDRKVQLSAVMNLDKAIQDLRARYPKLSAAHVHALPLKPGSSVARLHEVDPYPLIWWFRRHHTS